MPGPRVIVLHGQIGSGKTTTVNTLTSRYPDDRVVRVVEPVQAWERYLRVIYNRGSSREQVQRALVGMQHAVVVHHQDVLDRVALADANDIVIIERSPAESVHIFLEANRDVMLPEDFEAVRRLMQRLVLDDPLWQPGASRVLHVFIEQTVDECMARIRSRGRASETQQESSLDEGFMRRLDALYARYAEAVFPPTGMRLPPHMNQEQRAAAILAVVPP